MAKVEIHTDGSCLKNPGGIGGWAAILRTSGPEVHEKVLTGIEPVSTNNRMELLGVILGLKALKGGPHDVEIVSDSQYVVQAFTQGWVEKWRNRDWQKSSNNHRGFKPIPNIDLWKELYAEVQKQHVTWRHIRGHQGHELNERCDQLAYEAAVAYRDSLRGAENETKETNDAAISAATPTSAT